MTEARGECQATKRACRIAAGQALIRLAGDPHYVGGTVGVLAVLHTWGRTLVYHPHVHCLVTGGGLNLQTA